MKRLCPNTELPGPFRDRLRHTIKGYMFAIAFVLTLLAARCPAAVSRLVPPIVVDAIDGVVTCRLGAHVSKKGLEAVSPFIANQNSGPAVRSKCFVIWIKTAPFHTCPSSVFDRPLMFQLSARCPSALVSVAAATPRIAFDDVINVDHPIFSAFASAEPSGAPGKSPGVFDEGQPTKLFANHVRNSVSHNTSGTVRVWDHHTRRKS